MITTPSTFLPFAAPDIGEEEIAEVVETLRLGWLTTGPKTRRFESDFSDFLGEQLYTLAVNSATSGLHLALESVGVGSGDEVITTPYTFTATAEVIRYLGAHPVFVDILPDTLTLDPDRIAAKITSHTKAIVPVHFAGRAADMRRILSIARKYGLKVVEDAAHALPATFEGKMVGALESDATVFSFYATKTLATGEGGMIATRNPDIAARCKVMRLHGIDRDAFDRYRSNRPAWFYNVIAPGFKYNMTDIAAALGIQQLKKLWRFHEKRKAMAARYNSAFSDLPVILPPEAPQGDEHAWHLYVLRLTAASGVSRDRFIELMSGEGIGTSVHFIPLHLHPYWATEYGLAPSQFPESSRAYNSAVSLPLYTKMSEADQERVIRAVRKILEASRIHEREAELAEAHN